MITDTTAPSYWLNWRFLICAIWFLVAFIFATLLVWRYEGRKNSRNQQNGNKGNEKGCLYEGEVWGTCSKKIHPIWLLGYRIVAFGSLLALILADAMFHSGGIFYYYTQWTFTLVTIYFGLASSVSFHGCLHYCHKVDQKEDCSDDTIEQGSYIDLGHHDESNRRAASIWGYALQIIFQMCAGAVVLTDLVFWLIIYPFMTDKDYKLSFLVICMHSVNAVFLLGDTMLNQLRFPFFRIAYFVLWTLTYVLFQWIFHAFVSIRWPYPFLDLSSPYAPLWYLGVGLLHLPCFGIFTLIFKIKQLCLSRYNSTLISTPSRS